MSNLARMATPSFVSGPDAGALVTDIYKTNSQNNYNYNQSNNQSRSSSVETVAGMLGQVALSSVLARAGIQQPNTLMGNNQTPLYGIVGNNSSLSSYTRDMSPNANSMLGGISLPSTPLNMRMDGLNVPIPTTGLKDANALSGLVGGLSGNRNVSNVFNPNDVIGSATGALSLGSSLGVGNILPTIIPNIQKTLSGSGMQNPTGVLMSLVNNNLGSMVRGGDYASLKSIPSFTPPGTLGAMNPSFSKDVFSEYKNQSGGTEEVLYGDEDEFDDADEAIDAVNQNDNEWNKLKRQNAQGAPEVVTDVSSLSDASPDMLGSIKKKSRESVITEEKNYLLADAFPKGDISQQYAGVNLPSLKEPTNKASDLIDPNLGGLTVY